MAINFTRLSDPTTPSAGAGADLDITADGTVVCQLSYSYDGSTYFSAHPAAYLWYLDAAGMRYEAGPEINDPGGGNPVGSVQFSPAGDFLVFGTTEPRLVVYKRSGIGWARGPDSPVRCGGRAAFDATGTWLAVCGTWSGDSGIATFDTDTGQARMAATADDVGGWYAASWNPADPTLVAAVTGNSDVRIYRRTGDTLAQAGEPLTAAYGATQVAWHPSGGWLLANRYYDDYDDYEYYGAMIVDAYAWPGLDRIHTFKQLAQAGSFRFDATGQILAAGMTYSPDPWAGFGCGNAVPVGLVVMKISGSPSTSITADVLLRPFDDGGQVSGAQVAVTTDSGGLLHLAAATTADRWAAEDLSSSWRADNGMTVWPVQAPAFTVYTAQVGGVSYLYQKQPDGTYTLVGTTGQAISVKMPDGSQRSWPGAGFPLYQKQADGTWKKVIG